MASRFPSNRVAIVGIGATEFSKQSGRSELQLATECIRSALADAALRPEQVDGMTTFVQDTSAEIDIARNLGIPELRFFARVPYGGGAGGGAVALAVLALENGLADVVVVYRAFNERSGTRFGQPVTPRPTSDGINMSWYSSFGLATPAGFVAMAARRYMHLYGATSEDYGRVAVASRKHAATNPKAWFYQRPITLAEHQASRWIVEPLHLLDCCQESDGGVALVLTRLDRARDLPQRPALVTAAAQGSAAGQETMTSYTRPDIAQLPEINLVGRQLWAQSGLTPADIDTAILYDHFTPLVLEQLEDLGFCARGEARHFIANGAIEIGGRLPVNPHGGQLGEAYIHGMNGIAEAVRQIRGTAANQVSDCRNVLVTAGTAVPTSGLILQAP